MALVLPNSLSSFVKTETIYDINALVPQLISRRAERFQVLADVRDWGLSENVALHLANLHPDCHLEPDEDDTCSDGTEYASGIIDREAGVKDLANFGFHGSVAKALRNSIGDEAWLLEPISHNIADYFGSCFVTFGTFPVHPETRDQWFADRNGRLMYNMTTLPNAHH
ncbi:hypothetical protein HDU85_006539 [Gaertneriomyces sp. JEL0708]|nr:hypothetical protein HDU85_006539 [Gaertneriomyces sp. JEL0708]